MFRMYVIGTADSPLSARQRSLLKGCVLVVGGRRTREMVEDLSVRFQEITPLDGALTALRRALLQGNVAVLASGDPLFFGIGRRLLDEFPSEMIDFFPALSSIQRACALFRIPWDDARFTSLHGRKTGHIPGLLLGHPKHLVLTDTHNSPDHLAGQLISYLALIGEKELGDTIRIMVAEDLGLSSQRVFQGELAEACQRRFSALNVVCLLIPAIQKPSICRFGLTEEQLQHSRGLITKNEVRAATLHQLCLPETGVLWDIGAGSGSLSIEAARINPGLTIYAVEHKEEELRNIKNNIVKFRCFNIVPVAGRAPEVLHSLPSPQRVFIGGSGGALPAIIAEIAGRLQAGGILAVNGVAEKTIKTAPEIMRTHGFTVGTTTVQVTRTSPEGHSKTFNPITIMTAMK